ncbi:ran GTPase binding protein Mog1 [Schizosaccharomyces japonicus yFS275]|uniref:Ran GTPase binding protein Mog1 n=1 Tax=Schizosaccharomyces japonicus (strain yFS275 / FY16936) TaxID=402676 RepID=B6K321_SCHJY|nr:ran GTPase binding protein Mog1 [Schizosaccharomyces japonicus yFS275]EEB07878.2 ran GTPase binding protein Mog1 [Schizosaccharomyces japonicus yFS275]
MMVQLFGGALTAELPSSFCDVSKLREVPDNQEVFMENSDDMLSFIFELLEHGDAPGKTAAQFHFESLVDDNDAVASTIWSEEDIETSKLSHIASLGDNASVCRLTGFQQLPRDRHHTIRTLLQNIAVILYVIRCPKYQVDMVASLNVPLRNDYTDKEPLAVASLTADDAQRFERAGQCIDAFADSLTLVRPSLFG